MMFTNKSLKFRTCLVVLSMMSFLIQTAVSEDDFDYEKQREELKKARDAAKPWFLRNLEIGGTKIPISPVTGLIFSVLFINLFNIMFASLWAEAAHILIEDPSSNTKKMLEAMKKDIDDDYKRFGDYAAKYSQCPSKKVKGDLGRFKSGDMAPPFDKLVFNPKSPLETTLGPVQTQFGWHLIFIRARSKL
ncbi:unnamed protein product [Cylindrotheca closterium]|uniref:Peptidyl-prolyl cis-trans isomerase n=1 Tax=Cylindrotheca closterium TaxID=2856 RepID=A0AAD2G504_9STRA|nr:unnamed protein product [Cylindrotheca closterium]